MRKLYLFLIAISLLFCACKKDKKAANPGDISVSVKFFNGAVTIPIKGATVFTVPTSKEGITDENGSVLLKGIDIGFYKLYANLDGTGSGETTVQVVSDSVKKATVMITYGANLAFTPVIKIISLSPSANVSINENVVLSFTVNDDNTSSQDINVVLTSDLDGKLFETHPDASGNVIYETTTLSKGVHQITITATDKDKYVSTKKFSVSTLYPAKFVLDTAYSINGKVHVNWLKYLQNDFVKYEIFKSSNPNIDELLIGSFNSAELISCNDTTPPIVQEQYYYGRITNKEGKFRYSNKVKVNNPAGKMRYFPLFDAVHHPSKPLIYIIDHFSNKLRVLNHETNTEIDSASFPGAPGKIDIGDNGFGLEIYIPSSDGNIYAYDANTLKLNATINTGYPVASVVSNGHGYITASMIRYFLQDNPIRIYDRRTGLKISGTGEYDNVFMRAIPNSDNILTITLLMSPTKINRIELNSSGTVITNKIGNDDHGLCPSIFRISSNGQYFVTCWGGAVYTTDMVYKGAIGNNISFSEFAFGKDGNTIYGGTANEGSFSRPSIRFFKYPWLTKTNEYFISGYSKFLFYYNGEIISLSVGSLYNYNHMGFVIEKIKVE